ncbi:MAG: hypothetical protein K9J13_06165 [Saprospiraceae bacterium]|nr:hypothetical protein [Saprospiraceae bacterium]
MEELIKKCVRYFYNVLGENVVIDELKEINSLQLPYILVESYKFYDFIFKQKKYIMIHSINDTAITPGTYKKQINLIRRHSNKEVILLLLGIDSFNRKRLIDHKIQFIVPDKQMYIPSFGIDLREHFAKFSSPKKELRPAAQSILLYLLINRDYKEYDVDMLNLVTKYSKSSIRRAFLEFEDAGIGKISKVDKNKIFSIGKDFISIWEIARKYCINPVMKEIFISQMPVDFNLQIAGITALSEYSMLAPPHNREYAIYKEKWYRLSKYESVKMMIEPIQTETNIKLQIWSYPPNLWRDVNLVDRFSLYLSLKDEKDERIELALEEILEKELNG